MSRPTQTQAGALSGILASALILVLTAMALTSPPPARLHIATLALLDSGSAQHGAVSAQ